MTTMAEPEWDQATRELVIAHSQVDLCPRCGGPAELCQDPAHQFDWVSPPPVRCHRATAVLQAQEGIDERTNPHAEALIWQLPQLRELLEEG